MKGLKIAGFVLIGLGLLLSAIGYLFKVLHWPDLFKGIYSGPGVLLVGIVLLIVYGIKNKN